MAASATQNPTVKSESKSAKKKKAKIEPTEVSAPATPANENTSLNGVTEASSADGSYESPYIKELYKNIRNVNKKITNASKVDNVLAENPGKSLDELVATRKINADQKAQILKKPSLQASLVQLEEQIAQYKKFDQEYKAKSQAEKAEFEKTFTERASKDLEEKLAAAKEEAAADALKEQETSFLLISKFLQLAAHRRGDEHDPTLDENKAIEGLLHKVYLGNENAVTAMAKIIQGSEDTTSFNGELLDTTYAQVKAAALAQPTLPTVDAVESAEVDEEEEGTIVETTEYPVQSDPTIANAGLTELDEPSDTQVNDTHEANFEIQGVPQNSGFGDGAANAAAEANWDTNNDLSASQEWVEVPRDASETDTGIAATPAAPSNVQSWADDQPDSPVEKPSTPVINTNDGFHEVRRGGRDRGEFRGRGGRGGNEGYRGRGGRGSFTGGRGRGGSGRGSGGPPSRGGPRRSDES